MCWPQCSQFGFGPMKAYEDVASWSETCPAAAVASDSHSGS